VTKKAGPVDAGDKFGSKSQVGIDIIMKSVGEGVEVGVKVGGGTDVGRGVGANQPLVSNHTLLLAWLMLRLYHSKI